MPFGRARLINWRFGEYAEAELWIRNPYFPLAAALFRSAQRFFICSDILLRAAALMRPRLFLV